MTQSYAPAAAAGNARTVNWVRNMNTREPSPARVSI
jgi:hypothetical protein